MIVDLPFVIIRSRNFVAANRLPRQRVDFIDLVACPGAMEPSFQFQQHMCPGKILPLPGLLFHWMKTAIWCALASDLPDASRVLGPRQGTNGQVFGVATGLKKYSPSTDSDVRATLCFGKAFLHFWVSYITRLSRHTCCKSFQTTKPGITLGDLFLRWIGKSQIEI